jgi:hypothetical protein
MFIKQTVLSLFFVGLMACPATAQSPVAEESEIPFKVSVDHRVELMSVIFRLAGNPEYQKAVIPSYVQDVDKHFGPYKNHAVVKLAAKLRRTRGVSHDAPMSMAVHMPDIETLANEFRFEDRPANLDSRWRLGEANRFLKLAGQFVKETQFEQFMKSHQKLHEKAVNRMSLLVNQEANLEWFESFYGSNPQASFNIVLGLLNGKHSYGSRCIADGREQLYSILGVWLIDHKGMPRFPKAMIGTIVHEFSHSFVNPLVYSNIADLEKAGKQLFSHVEKNMRKIAYGSWPTMMHESIIRACEVRYAIAYGGTSTGEKTIAYNQKLGFLWTGELAELLGEYEANRKQYPTLESFFPRIIEFFNEYAESGTYKSAKESTAIKILKALIKPPATKPADN